MDTRLYSYIKDIVGLFGKSIFWLKPHVSQPMVTDEDLSVGNETHHVYIHRTPGCFVLAEQYSCISYSGAVLTR